MASRSSSDPGPSGRESGGGSAPGLREQFGRTRSALFGLIGAHVKMAQAEFSEIFDQIKQVAILAAIAFALLFLAGMTLVVGLVLWIDEWAFGSIGWGTLHGPELFICLAALALLAVIDLGWRRLATSLLMAVVVAVAVGFIVGADWKHIGDTTYAGLSSSGRPFVLAMVWGGAVCAVIGGVMGGYFSRVWTTVLGAVLGLILGIVFGLAGALHPGVQIGVAVGLAVGLLVWPLWAAALVFRHGLDFGKLKARFLPTETIETTKETIEWVREQLPLGRK